MREWNGAVREDGSPGGRVRDRHGMVPGTGRRVAAHGPIAPDGRAEPWAPRRRTAGPRPVRPGAVPTVVRPPQPARPGTSGGPGRGRHVLVRRRVAPLPVHVRRRRRAAATIGAVLLTAAVVVLLGLLADAVEAARHGEARPGVTDTPPAGVPPAPGWVVAIVAG